jgi:hypothetical protein
MKAIRTRQRYRCDYCKHTGTKDSMLRHEERCFKNPNRYCRYCRNTGTDCAEGDLCPYCVAYVKCLVECGLPVPEALADLKPEVRPFPQSLEDYFPAAGLR